ncbi:MAG: hypothetical protein UT41_C0001G0614 [Candidatus Wolfebacteria bacterium GW2011_GWC2_39_22]|uniref:Uncharacterized protein n=2 Tax=Candidatus Wolfeibacteriota TaxID=1752735 RepID=A0A0G1H7H5_9BACT|nr:MAG: hypothetical protein UT41_C0001G0614 [Candidatus Wolfebacteria bacterium GW2011_GWC2_39_22]KKT42740.1 MAG: hypothetical protein UW32_C0004G0045 [Candidatus Wolfebacteria bacterium GW2011_GWE2_44_13]
MVDRKMQIMSPEDWEMYRGKIVAMDGWPKDGNPSPVIASGATTEELGTALRAIGRSFDNVIVQIVTLEDRFCFPATA